MTCDRCRQPTNAHTGSYFNLEQICLDCAGREREHPDYERARQAEAAACQQGNFNFPGIGKPADL